MRYIAFHTNFGGAVRGLKRVHDLLRMTAKEFRVGRRLGFWKKTPKNYGHDL